MQFSKGLNIPYLLERPSTCARTGLMQRLNPTGSLLRARPFVARHDYIFTLLCLLNVNMGALNTSAMLGGGETADGAVAADGDNYEIRESPSELSLEMVLAQGLLDDMAGVFQQVQVVMYALRTPLLVGVVVQWALIQNTECFQRKAWALQVSCTRSVYPVSYTHLTLPTKA